MKLLTRYNRLNIIATITIFIVGSCTFYFLLHYILISQVDDTLKTEKQEIIEYLKEHGTLPEIIHTKDQITTYQKSDDSVATSFHYAFFSNHDDRDLFRQISFSRSVNGQHYYITVSEPLERTEALLQVIIIVTIGMVALILLTGYLINRTVLGKIWKPFYNTIEQVKTYNIAEQKIPNLQPTNIDEFSLLNQSITNMTNRVWNDYKSLKEFTSHAAHEMQTPLAVIRMRLDLLIQNENIVAQHAQQILDIEKAVNRLSRLYQSLLLLTKVENRQFSFTEMVRLNEVINDKCAELSDMIDAKALNVSIQLQPVSILFHQHLAEIVVNNLLGNAIRYNKSGGTINIMLTSQSLAISNTSDFPALDADKVFQRFYRYNEVTEDGNGLGLSIVKQICDAAGFTLRYQYKDNLHVFSIFFDK